MFFRMLGTTFPVLASHPRRLELLKTVSLPMKFLSSVQNSSLVGADKGYTVTVKSKCGMWNFFFDFIILILLNRYCTFSYLNAPDVLIRNKFTELVNNKKMTLLEVTCHHTPYVFLFRPLKFHHNNYHHIDCRVLDLVICSSSINSLEVF